MTDPKAINQPASTPDQLIDTGISASGELSDQASPAETPTFSRSISKPWKNNRKWR
jgi:hypothetical protein